MFNNIAIHFELLSEVIFGSGEAVPGYVDLEVVHDENGLPYFKAKTFKGKLREESEKLFTAVGMFDESLGDEINSIVTELYGKEDSESFNTLKFSNCTLDKEIISAIKYGIEKDVFTSNEVLEALTEVRSFTSIDEDGIAKEGSLRQLRVVKKGYKFVCEISSRKQLDDMSLAVLAASIKTLRHIGTMESRGKGEIDARLIIDGKDVTDKYLDKFREKVNA